MFAIPLHRAAARISLSLIIVIAALSTPRSAEASWRSLTGRLPAYTNAPNVIFSPDSHLVAFVADIDTDDTNELYAMPITGTTPIKLNPPLVANGDVSTSRFYFTTDSQYILYLADQEVDNLVEMFRVPVGGGESVKISPPMVAGGNVANLKIDPESGRVVYEADQETNEVFELWSITVEGGGLTKLSGPFVLGGDTGIFAIDTASNRVVYSADQETDGKFELYSVPIAGGAVTKLNPPITLAGGGDSGLYSEFAVHPSFPVVVFIAREAGSLGGRVYMIPTAGGPPTQLSFNLTAVQRILSFRISPAGDRVVFNVGTRDGSTNAFKGNLYSALIGGGGAANVTETADPLFGTDNYAFVPDGSRVVYTFQNNASSPIRLEAATMLGVRTPLYVPGVSDAPLSFFRLSSNSQWVMYQTGTDFLAKTIYTVPPGGGSPTNHGPGEFAALMPDSSRIVFQRETGSDNRHDLFSAQIFGGGVRNLSGMNGMGYVANPAASSDSQWIVYLVQLDERYELRASDGNAAPPPVYLPMMRK